MRPLSRSRRSAARLGLLTITGLVLAACGGPAEVPAGPDFELALDDGLDEDAELGVLHSPIAIPGMWMPPASTLAIGDRQVVARQGPPRVSDGGQCPSTNPWTCSCVHPACSRGLPGTLEFASFLRMRFPQIRGAGGFDCCRQNTGNTAYLSVHSIGRAIDLTIRQINGDADNTAGDEVANWLVEHAQDIGVQLVVWDRASWNAGRAPGGRLNPYTGPIPHTDHIHVELNLDGANRRTPFFTSGASRGGPSCEARCEGTVIVRADCSTGDCGAFGVACIADPAPRCVVPGCPTTGTGSICLDDSRILRCKDGLPDGEAGNCGAFGAFCSVAGVAPTAARCVSALCVSGPTEVPVENRRCSINAGKQLDCFADGQIMERDCPAGTVCSMRSGAVDCVPPQPECPVPAAGAPLDDRIVCLGTGELARCLNGNVATAQTCGPGLSCVDSGGPARCAVAECVRPDGTISTDAVCTAGGDLGRCDALGGLSGVTPCPSGQACTTASGRAVCAPGERPEPDDGEDLPGVMIEPDAGLAPGADGGTEGGAASDAGAGAALDGGIAPSGCAAATPGAGWPVLLLLAGLALRRRR